MDETISGTRSCNSGIINCFAEIRQLKLKHPTNVSCAYLNINSIRNKFVNLKDMIEQNIDILCIAETKIDSSFPTNQFHMPGYTLPYRLDKTGNSGGLLVYIKETIPSKYLSEFTIPKDIQAIPIEINFRKCKWLLLPIYRPPDVMESYFIEQISALIDYYSNTYDNILTLGDFNNEATDAVLSPLIDGHDLYSLIKDPTCFKSKKGKCIDLFLTNRKHNFFGSKTFETGMSDHHVMIYTIFRTTFIKIPPQKIYYRCKRKFSQEKFEKDLSSGLKNIIPGDTNALLETIELILNRHQPLKQKILRGNNKPFVNKLLKKAISTRSRFKNIANKTGNIGDIEKYKKHRNYVKRLNAKTKKYYFENLNPKKLEMNKTFWQTFKPYFSSKYTPVEKLILVENNSIISDDITLADTMNDYFSNVTKKLNIIEWPTPIYVENEDSVNRAIRRYANHPSILKIKSLHGNVKKFEFSNVLPETMRTKIHKLNKHKCSSGPIPTEIFKDYVDLCCTPITDCFNAAVNNCVFPESLKLADITPALKKDDKTNKKNYRPISLLPPLSKTFERLICDQINEFMRDKLSPLLCGFRKGYSTQYALLRLLEQWRSKLDNKYIIGTILCDLSKAFDTLPHDLIIAKLEAYGFGHNSLTLILDYLTNRKQRCKVGSKYSNWLEILIGVPQGSVLGPLLFNIFINDIFLFLISSDICNFADDTSLSAYDRCIINVINKLESELKIALNWFNNNSLVPNPDKFQIMFLGTKHKVNLCLEINGIRNLTTTSVKLLGITIDWKLNFNDHVKELCKKANSKSKAIARLRNYLHMDQKMLLFNSFIMSCFGYCPIVWMFCGKVSNEIMNRTHRRALRAIYNDYNSDYATLLLKGNHQTIHERNLKLLLSEVYKCVNNKTPTFLWNIFNHKESSYKLRISDRLILPKTSTKLGLHSFTYRGSSCWNNIPDDIKTSENSSIFDDKLKNLHIANICNCKICLK